MLSVTVAHWVVEAALLYTAIGLGISIGFLITGIERVDPAARHAYAFRPLLLPGLAALWPLVAWRWWRALR